MFANTGLIPFLVTLAGGASRVDVTTLLVISGEIIALISLTMPFNRPRAGAHYAGCGLILAVGHPLDKALK